MNHFSRSGIIIVVDHSRDMCRFEDFQSKGYVPQEESGWPRLSGLSGLSGLFGSAARNSIFKIQNSKHNTLTVYCLIIGYCYLDILWCLGFLVFLFFGLFGFSA